VTRAQTIVIHKRVVLI